jgi:hypothetical protein
MKKEIAEFMAQCGDLSTSEGGASKTCWKVAVVPDSRI